MNLTGRRVVVTGASSGIGKHACGLLSSLGAELILVGRNLQTLKETADSLEGSGHTISVFDLADVDAIPGLLKSIAEESGPLSGLFHAAGMESVRPLSLIKEQHIDEVLGPSFKAAALLIRGFCQKSVRPESMGSIVIMSSVTSVSGQAGMGIYAASKGAIDAAVRSFACDAAGLNIRINTIVSGAVETEMHQRLTKHMSPEALEEYKNKHLLGFGQPEDISQAVAFLLSNAAKWITGTTLVVDGGYTCR
jgi:NAD(P)-dependent dehydrogenase (short-subunit alcohol dehydrogenase family)